MDPLAAQVLFRQRVFTFLLAAALITQEIVVAGAVHFLYRLGDLRSLPACAVVLRAEARHGQTGCGSSPGPLGTGSGDTTRTGSGMSDPLIAIVASGLLGAALAAAALDRALGVVPEGRRRGAEWAALAAAMLVAFGALLAVGDSGAGPISGALLVGSPPFMIFVLSGSVVASLLVTLVPVYIFIAAFTRGRVFLFSPETALDRAIPLEPAWMLAYGSIWVFVLLPLMVARQRELLLRAARADIALLLFAYGSFLLLPTAAPRPERLHVDGFAAWTLRIQYDIDPPYNCFPSLHVAHSFVSALTAYRIHPGVGIAATAWAALIGVSTVYTKQHYVADVVVGALASFVAYGLFGRGPGLAFVPAEERARAPRRALAVLAMYAVVVAGFYVAYRLGLGAR